MNVSLITLAEAKQFLPIREGNTGFDAKLLSMNLAATTLLGNWCRQSWVRAEHTDYFATRSTNRQLIDLHSDDNMSGVLDAPYESRYRLRHHPVDEDETITVYYDPTRVFAADTVVPDTQWFFDPKTNQIILLRGVSQHPRALKVVYTAGFAVTEGDDDENDNLSASAPPDLKLACQTQVLFMFNKIESGSVGTEAQADGGEVFADSSILCSEAKELAAPYRRWARGA